MRKVIRRALLSVSDKTGIIELARCLADLNIEILSTGGTAQTLREANIPTIDVADYTAFPEMMDGRVKTLHPKIHGALLGRRGVDDAIMQAHAILPIDLVVVNLYPFARTIANKDCTLAQAIENIDIGGPSMLRSAAKNHADVAVVVDPADYPEIMQALQNGGTDQALRNRLALKAFCHTADYDRTISNYLRTQYAEDKDGELPQRIQLDLERVQAMRYGENPHQKAGFYRLVDETNAGLLGSTQHQGKELSYNNIADGDTAWQCVLQLSAPACVIIKHANPCGVAVGADAHQAYVRALSCDPTSAFGGIIAFNTEVTPDCAQEIINRQFVELVIAPRFSKDALAIFAAKPNVRVLSINQDIMRNNRLQIHSVSSGVLLQEWDNTSVRPSDCKIVSKRAPSADEMRDLMFAWQVVKVVKSNAIVLAKDGMTLGIGGGQTSRVYSSKIAVQKAQDEGFELNGAVLASDAFFPFRDGVDEAALAGVKAIIQPGGSMRDQEVITAADEHGIAMVFTGIRHFRH